MLKRFQRWLSDEHPEQVIIDMRPERPRHWHNPSDPIQAARIEAAREKRILRCRKIDRMTAHSYERNPAHFRHSASLALDPFYVVRS